MRRWTDGKSWSASRVSGSFLTYREMEGKRGGNGFTPPAQAPKRPSGKTPDGSKEGDSDEGPDGYRYKPDGLMKQSFSITTSDGRHLHLISYYARSHPSATNLQQPTQDPSLRHIRPPKNMYPESTVNETANVPAVTRGPMPGSPYASAHVSMGLGSPYNRPPNGAPAYIPAGNWPPTPSGTPPYQYAYYPPPQAGPPGHAPIPYGAQVIYAQPYPHHPPPGPTVFDRAPPPISSTLPPPPPNHMAPIMNGHPHYAHHPQYIHNPSPRAIQAPLQHHQHAPLSNHMNGGHPAEHIREQGPQLPAINGSAQAPSQQEKPPSPQSLDQRAQKPDSLAVPDTNGTSTTNATSPARTIPSVDALLNQPQAGQPADTADGKSNPSNSRSGSRSPTHTQRSTREVPGDRLNGNSADKQALHKLNQVMLV